MFRWEHWNLEIQIMFYFGLLGNKNFFGKFILDLRRTILPYIRMNLLCLVGIWKLHS